MTHVLELIRGDKRNPVETLDLAAGTSTGSIFIRAGGFSPGPGPLNVVFGGARENKKRTDSYRDLSRVALTYDLNAGSVAELKWLQSEIDKFFEYAGFYEEDYQGDPIWLRYRWSDSLDLPEPVFGQFSKFLRILSGDVPSWPGGLHNSGMLAAGQIEAVVANLTCRPYPEGLENAIFNESVGQIEMSPHGIVIPRAITNECTNPGFGHSTWDNGWTASNAALKATQETRKDFTRSMESAALLSNTDTSTNYLFTQTLTLTADTYIISCFARKLDGSAVSASDMAMVGQASVQAATFEAVDGGPWYLVFATYTAAAAASTHGVRVNAKKTVIIDDVQIENMDAAGSDRNGSHPLWHCAGHKLGCAWSGTAHASTSTRDEGQIALDTSFDIQGEYTIAFWFTAFWDTQPSETSPDFLYIFDFYNDANNSIGVTHQLNNTLNFNHRVGGTTYQASDTQAFTYGTPYHICLVYDNSNAILYINGSQLATSAAAPPVYVPSGSKLALGCDESTTGYEAEAAFDGLKIWREALSATEVSDLYDSEVEIADQDGRISDIPAFWTKDGDGTLDNCDDTSRDNWGVGVGIPGEVEALTRWEIQLPTATPERVHWLGRKASTEMLIPINWYGELQGTVNAASSGGEYNTTAAGVGDTAVVFINLTTFWDAKFMPGRYKVLGRMQAVTNPIDVYPQWHMGAESGAGNMIDGDTTTLAATAGMVWRDLGDINVKYLTRHLEKNLAKFSARLWLDRTLSAAFNVDFIALLPYPCCRVEQLESSLTINSGELLIIDGTSAYTFYTNQVSDIFEHQFEPVNLVPGQYNYVWFYQGEEAGAYTIGDTADFDIYVIPRFLLPG